MILILKQRIDFTDVDEVCIFLSKLLRDPREGT